MAYYGIKSGMTYSEHMAYLFDLNSQLKTKLSDQQLIIRVIKEFPYRKELLTKLTHKKLRHYRTLYNLGQLNSDYPAPKLPSLRYIKGVAVTRYDTPITNDVLKIRLQNQLKRWKRDHVRRLKKEITKKPRPKKRKTPKVRKDSIRKRIRIGTRKAHKKYQKRLWLQKQMARLQGVSPWED